MRTLKTREAAGALHVSPSTLRDWERRFGYPRPLRSAGNHRLYPCAEIDALGEALKEGLSISSAISAAREAVGCEIHSLVAPLTAFDAERADSAMEAALALGTMERAVTEFLMGSLCEIERRYGSLSAQWGFAVRWACEWLRRAQRIARPSLRRLGIVVGDASRPELDFDAVTIRAFELLCTRAGARVLSLPVQSIYSVADAVAAVRPHGLVVAGSWADDDIVARWGYAIRAADRTLPFAWFRRDCPEPQRAARGIVMLPPTPLGAQAQVFAIFRSEPLRMPRVRGGRLTS